jgi:hypothetical protein
MAQEHGDVGRTVVRGDDYLEQMLRERSRAIDVERLGLVEKTETFRAGAALSQRARR